VEDSKKKSRRRMTLAGSRSGQAEVKAGFENRYGTMAA
jgi:hypothetical protein